ncbi:hypothetical protein Glove_579g10 [Diversispora epigaea]|uniref:Uncharacterized protein n=1 Tax=Diversispora epigaea TaxID=1348612 RepID=A0A397GCW0_9GLOM|nr:hypothetical protein Glove_579g10 [Diversispora epigaea]
MINFQLVKRQPFKSTILLNRNISKLLLCSNNISTITENNNDSNNSDKYKKGKYGYAPGFSPPPPPVKNKRKKEYKQEAKERRNKKVTVTDNNLEERKVQDNNNNNNNNNNTPRETKETVIYVDGKKRAVPIIDPPKISENKYNNDAKRYKDELKLLRYKYKLELGLAVSSTDSQDNKNISRVVDNSKFSLGDNNNNNNKNKNNNKNNNNNNSNKIKNNKLNDNLQKKDEGNDKKLEIINVSNDVKDETIYTTPKDLLKNQNVWRQKIRAEREADLRKLQETSGILSLSSTRCMVPPDYRALKRERGIEKFNLLQKRKRQERLNYLIDLYHRTSSFVTLNNLDSKIEASFSKTQRVYTNTLDDMQMDYNEMGGGVSDEEVLKRLNQIYDILGGTSHGRKYPGADQIIKPNPPPDDSLSFNFKDEEYENEVKVEEIEKTDEDTDLGLLALLKDDETEKIDKIVETDKID